MNTNVKLLLLPFIADLIFIYISEKEEFSLWQNKNNFLPFFLPLIFSPPRIEYFILKSLIISVEWHDLKPPSIRIIVVFWQAFDHEH